MTLRSRASIMTDSPVSPHRDLPAQHVCEVVVPEAVENRSSSYFPTGSVDGSVSDPWKEPVKELWIHIHLLVRERGWERERYPHEHSLQGQEQYLRLRPNFPLIAMTWLTP